MMRALSDENAAQRERIARLQATLGSESVAYINVITQPGFYKCDQAAAGVPHGGAAWDIVHAGSGAKQGFQIAVSAARSEERLMRSCDGDPGGARGASSFKACPMEWAPAGIWRCRTNSAASMEYAWTPSAPATWYVGVTVPSCLFLRSADVERFYLRNHNLTGLLTSG